MNHDAQGLLGNTYFLSSLNLGNPVIRKELGKVFPKIIHWYCIYVITNIQNNVRNTSVITIYTVLVQ